MNYPNELINLCNELYSLNLKLIDHTSLEQQAYLSSCLKVFLFHSTQLTPDYAFQFYLKFLYIPNH